MALRPPDETFVHTDIDLFQLWCDLMGPGGFAQRSLWSIFIEDGGRMSPVVVPIDGIPDEPDAVLLGNFAGALEDVVVPPVCSVAMLISRPGPPLMSAGDRRWARALREALSPDVMPWPVHLATSDLVRVFSGDDLISAGRR